MDKVFHKSNEVRHETENSRSSIFYTEQKANLSNASLFLVVNKDMFSSSAYCAFYYICCHFD